MKQIINTHFAPTPIGPYRQAVVHNGILYTSGQIALDPKTMELVTTNIEIETEQIMENLNAVLNAANTDFSKVLKTTIFITDMNDFGAINKIYGSYFDEAFAPARETVQVSFLPKGVNVEISMIVAI